MKDLKSEERLIVAADYSPEEFGGTQGVKKKVLALANDLKGLGVYIKVNSILRALGHGLITKLHDLGLKVFADFKLIDIPKTMKIDAEMLKEAKPEILTVMCCSGVDGMRGVQKTLKGITEVLGVTVLTSLDEDKCKEIFACSPETGVLKFARMAQSAGLGGLILSPKEVEIIKNEPKLALLSLNTPGIRPEWSIIKDDDQARVLTPLKAIESGSERIVMGRPITEAGPNDKGLPQSPREATERTLEEIRQGLGS